MDPIDRSAAESVSPGFDRLESGCKPELFVPQNVTATLEASERRPNARWEYRVRRERGTLSASTGDSEKGESAGETDYASTSASLKSMSSMVTNA